MEELECGACATSNPPTARFCMRCGAQLGQACPACKTEAPPEARFCPGCGTALADGSPAPAPSPARPERRTDASVEERRRVTILFADLSGYTAVSERLDPEEVRQIADRSLRRLAAEVDRFGGTVDKYIGDNVMAIFGAPVAHEDDPERAVRAGLAMQNAMEEINADLEPRHGVRFQLRVGINTGEVLAGEVAGSYTVIGDAVNVAARLQAAGAPGTVIVGRQTEGATRHAVAYRQLEPLTLKGKAAPVQAWEAIEPLAASPAARSAGDAPLVGRADELGQLQATYRRTVADGRPHLVTVVGEAGVGKSRLLDELTDRLASGEPPPVVRQGRCLAYGSGTVYWALGEILRDECGIDDADSASVAWEKLERRVQALTGEQAGDTASIVGRLLGMEPPPGRSDPVEALDQERLRERFFASVRAVVEGMARERPLLLALEDIHWADQGMLDLVEHLAQWARGPVLIVAVTRDELLERRAAWGSGRRATLLFLDPLSSQETRALVEALMPSAGAAAPAVAERAGGNPLFAEEMVRRLADSGRDSVDELPDTVHALLAARLDSLPPLERRVVQQAAVVGRTFSAETLEALVPDGNGELGPAVRSLVDKELFVPAGGPGSDSEMSFKHVLIRDVAYGMLPRATRARNHMEVGRLLEQRAGARSDEVAVLLAEHYGRAATLGAEARLDEPELDPMRQSARGFLEAAGDAAARFFSNEEAFDHYAGAVELLRDPADRARVADKQGDAALRLGRTEAALAAWRPCLEHHRSQEDLPAVGRTLRKIGAALTEQGERGAAIEHYQQGMNLLKDGPPSRELVRLYEDAAWLYVQSGDNMLAIYASEKALRLAQQLGEAAAVSRAHGIFGRVFSRIGDAERARENLEKAVDSARGGDDPLEEVLALIALAGHLEVAEAAYEPAEQSYRDALTAAERIGDVPSQVELHSALAWLAVHRADWDAVRRLSDASAQLAEGAGLVLKLCLPFALRGLLAWRDGDWQQAHSSYQRAAELAQDTGWSEVAFASLYGLAVTERDGGDYDAAVTSLERALTIAERGGLSVQSVMALAARAVTLTLAGRAQEARTAAEQASDACRKLSSPVGEAAVLEAAGATATPEEAPGQLARARDRWRELGRPLDASRCELLAATILARSDPDGAAGLAASAADDFEGLGVAHLAKRARELALR